MSKNTTKSPGRQAKPAAKGSPQTPGKAHPRLTHAGSFKLRAAKVLSKLAGGRD